MNDDQPLDIFALLDEVQATARTGLHFSENPFDRERYTRLLDTAQRQYAAHTSLDNPVIAERFESEIGYVTAKVGADAAVFDDQDRILVARRADDDKWGLIAGWVDPNESPEQTAVRELAEEVGVQARVDRLVGVFFREARAASTRTARCRSSTWRRSRADGPHRSPTRSASSRGGRSTTWAQTNGITITRRSRAPRSRPGGGHARVSNPRDVVRWCRDVEGFVEECRWCPVVRARRFVALVRILRAR